MSFGSKRWFPYVDDGGSAWGVNLDESNVEMIIPASDGITVPAGINGLPPEIKPRSIKMVAADGTSKTVVVLGRIEYDAINIGQSFAEPAVGGSSAAGTSFVVVQKIPERLKNPPIPVDTGKNDGDQP